MLEIVGIIVLVIVAAIAAVLIIAATRPDTFRIMRSATIQAPPERIFPLINDFHNWTRWSPWEKLDPALQRSYSGAASGKGAAYAWQGNNKVGQGRMEIVDAAPPSRVTIKLDFIKPFEAHNMVDFTLQPQGGATGVSWDMHGPLPLMARVMHMFMNMDRMVGKDFEKGLASLKAEAEK